mgnify:CR=1 FL=1
MHALVYTGTQTLIYREEKNPKVTVHEIVTKIDAGKVLFTKNYKFDFGKSYKFNENIAYDAGIDCFFEIIRKQ